MRDDHRSHPVFYKEVTVTTHLYTTFDDAGIGSFSPLTIPDDLIDVQRERPEMIDYIDGKPGAAGKVAKSRRAGLDKLTQEGRRAVRAWLVQQER
jgi:hypothetical protein